MGINGRLPLRMGASKNAAWFRMAQAIFTILAVLGDHKGRPYRGKIVGATLVVAQKL